MEEKGERVSKTARGRGAKVLVFKGHRERTAGGLRVDIEESVRNIGPKTCKRIWETQVREHRAMGPSLNGHPRVSSDIWGTDAELHVKLV